jgi:UDP-3-O-[3-hydroxymyristoyl] glucosamine N-acyltransferase
LADLAARVGGRVSGDPERAIRGVATLERAEPSDLAFLTNPRYRKSAESTRAGAILVGEGVDLAGRDLLIAEHPYAALAEILEVFHPEPAAAPGVSADARIGVGVRLGTGVSIGAFTVVGDGAEVGDGVGIGPGCAVGEECVIGEGTRLHARVVLYPRTRVGKRCILHSGAVIGADGFGFATRDGVHRKIPQVGRVVLEDDVEIGANTAIDRGAIDDTVIGAGTKIDDLVMVAHGVRIGPGGLLAAQAGIAGSTRLGSHVVLAGQSGLIGHLQLGDRVVVAAKAAVFDDVPSRTFVAGIPATDHRAWKRVQAALKDLPRLRTEVRRLRARIVALEGGAAPDSESEDATRGD